MQIILVCLAFSNMVKFLKGIEFLLGAPVLQMIYVDKSQKFL